jgi:Cu+-exporting ATPase
MEQEKTRIVLKVTGMSCSGCAANVKSALSSVPGVISAEVDLKTGIAEISISERKPSGDQLIAAIKKAGFDARIF